MTEMNQVILEGEFSEEKYTISALGVEAPVVLPSEFEAHTGDTIRVIGKLRNYSPKQPCLIEAEYAEIRN